MAILLDTGVLYAYYDRRDTWHSASKQLIEAEVGGLIVPSPVIPEVDYLLGERLGLGAQKLFYQGLAEGSFFIAEVPQEGYPRILDLNEKYPALRLGFVDAAVMAVAEHLGLGRIGTTDRRHFGAVQGAIPFELFPT